jgi:hypothetical protein
LFSTVTVIVSRLGVWLLKIATFPSPTRELRIVTTTGTKGVMPPQPVNSPIVETHKQKDAIKLTINLCLLKFSFILIPTQISSVHIPFLAFHTQKINNDYLEVELTS